MGLFKVAIVYLQIALLPVGAAIGSTACGPMLNIFSRRHALIITDVVSIIGFSLA
jgi:hypothetical protein